MQFFLYARKNGKDENRLEVAIRSATTEGMIERFTRLDKLQDRLRFIVEPDSILVMVAADREELLKMQVFQDQLTEIFIILVIPDWKESTIRFAHLLKPRFLSLIKDDFMDLNQIIAKMIQTPH